MKRYFFFKYLDLQVNIGAELDEEMVIRIGTCKAVGT